jgi:penicillin G amidase
MIWIRRLLAVLLTLVSLVTLGIYWFAHKQGGLTADFKLLEGTRVVWDAHKVPTLEAKSWPELIEAQGFVVASERLFQMDLMRRSGAGRLSEWFGGHPSAVDWDRRRRLEDWQGVAEAVAAKMQGDDRLWCEAYARGVNRFIESMPWRWGIEYVVLTQRPDAWKCADTVLVLMSLVDDLTRSAEHDALTTVWKEKLPDDWFQFLFPHDHPWNEPLFGRNERRLRPPSKNLPAANIDDTLVSQSVAPDAFFPGSNSWFWAGKTGAFLANDPHLGMTVPQIWYAIRLRISAEEWVVGATVPGLPGVILGRNPSLSWAFTNAMEDVDDLLEEVLSEDGKQYVASVDSGKKIFRPVVEKEYAIKVRGEADVTGIARFTHRGPLLKYPELGSDRWFSRQWIGFNPERITLPVASLNRARSWPEANKAIDQFLSPAQNVTVSDNAGNVGYRLSGTGVRKKQTSMYAVPALRGEWQGFEPSSERKRKTISRSKALPTWLSTANQRIYTDPFGHSWSSDVRQSRIAEVLKSSKEHTQQSMQQLQLDTTSRYLKRFADWLVKHNDASDVAMVRVRNLLSQWDGTGKSDPHAFFLAVEAHRVFTRVLMAQVRNHLLPSETRDVPYSWKNQNAWLVYLMENPKALDAFGVNPKMLAHFVLKKVSAMPPSKGYLDANRWKAQHPMAAAVPLLGTWLEIDEHPQWGFEGLVRVERERSGASLRVVWNIDEPMKSTWVFPVGQSGHVASRHYKDFRNLWFAESQAAVFDPALEWEFSR